MIFEVSGQCLCGGMRFSGRVDSRDVTACHCGPCRRWSDQVRGDEAMFWASHVFDRQHASRRYRRTTRARRRFCADCGTSLFWHVADEAGVDVSAGVLDVPGSLRPGAASHAHEHSDSCKMEWLR